MKETGRLLVFPNAPRILREVQIPPSRRVTMIRKDGVLIDLAAERVKRRPPTKGGR